MGSRGVDTAEKVAEARVSNGRTLETCAQSHAVYIHHESGKHQCDADGLQRRERLVEQQRSAHKTRHGNQQRKRRYERGWIAVEKTRPRCEAEQRRDVCKKYRAAPRQRTGMCDGLPCSASALECIR